MWNLKTVYLHQASKLREYLNDGWEPFAVLEVSNPKGELVKQIFLRKSDVQSPNYTVLFEELDALLDRKLEDAQLMINGWLASHMTPLDLGSEVTARIAMNEYQHLSMGEPEAVDPSVEAFHQTTLREGGSRTDLPLGNEEDVLVVKREPPPFSQADLQSSRQVTPIGEAPAESGSSANGDDPRFQEVHTDHQQTEAQQEAIREIRRREKVNLTISPVYDDGSVHVFARQKDYTVKADGAYSFSSPTKP